MYKIAKPLFLHCQTSMHAGSGDDLGIVDLPIQREKHTGFPKIEASTLKGTLRESFEEAAASDNDHIKIQAAFGFDGFTKEKEKQFPIAAKAFENKEYKDYAGALGFTDARILLFPLKSLKGIFVYATCPAVLKKLKKELVEVCEIKTALETDFAVNHEIVAVANPTPLSTNGKITIEEYSFNSNKAEVNDKAKKLATQLKALLNIDDLENKLLVLDDEAFADFAKNSTEVVTRIKIDNEKGTVAKGALFTEEYLPAESVLYALVLASPVFAKNQKHAFDSYQKATTHQNILAYFKDTLKPIVQIGGNATLGKGIVKTIKTQL